MSSISASHRYPTSLLATSPGSLAGKVSLSVAASLFVALCAHVSFPMPFTPVPTTLQTFAVILVGMTLGPVTGFAALALYLAEGAVGLPVFSPQGLGGIAQLLGPTGGYLLAYPFAAALAGLLVRRLRSAIPSFPAALLSGIVALIPIFAIGSTWLAVELHLPPTLAFHLAVTPFLAAELVKLLAAAGTFGTLRTLSRR